MSTKDLIAEWREALALALSQQDEEDPVTELHDDDLTNVATGPGIVRSNVRGGATVTFLVCFC